MIHPPPRSTLFPYTTLFRSIRTRPRRNGNSTLTFMRQIRLAYPRRLRIYWIQDGLSSHWTPAIRARSEEHTSELQSHSDLVCRLLLEKKKKKKINNLSTAIT